MKFPLMTALLSAMALYGCAGQGTAAGNSSWQKLTFAGAGTATVLDKAPLAEAALEVQALSGQGLRLVNTQGKTLASLDAGYESLDSRALGGQWLISAVDTVAQKADLLLVSAAGQFATAVTLPSRPYPVDAACLFQDDGGNSFVFLISEDGIGEQWLVASQQQVLAEPLSLRTLPLPPQATFCAVDDVAGLLYVNEESQGVWAYPAAAEADTLRLPVAQRAPFGTLGDETASVAVVPGGVLVTDPSTSQLHLYRRQGEQWQLAQSLALPDLGDPEQLRVSPAAGGFEIAVRDDDSGEWYQRRVDWQAGDQGAEPGLPYVKAAVQSEPVRGFGDAADDPAIWVDARSPQRSLILGTNKKLGLKVYNLEGELLQSLDIGRLNNVDVRQGVVLDGQSLDLAVASHRDNNSLSLFVIDPLTGRVRHAADLPTDLADIYGICLYQPSTDKLYAFANSKDGTVVQYHIAADGADFQADAVRRWRLASQPEGCVADDSGRRLFVGEEDVGVWAFAADADASTEQHAVVMAGASLKADVEGLALYHRGAGLSPLLVVSSQGNDSYLVIDSEPPYRQLANFRVGINAAEAIDGSSETDGLDVSSANLGGIWSEGILVVQDGRNRLPQAQQNFKLVPWSAIAPLLREVSAP
ncbi:phytase [Parahaliea maris]|uniref:Phytase n=1 Tax=Parahaliea maris TaxID=2716870 RepID=A0A5C8ZU22_9GAMM|nr:phytase [Parahaliea maris]TXS90771.1 phytase [Parahaliea maris]